MIVSGVARLFVTVTLIATLLAGSAVVDQPALAAGDGWIDTHDRDAVLAAFQHEFGGSEPTMGWTGNRGSCQPGTTSQAFRNAIFDRVNYFRAQAGVPTGVTENAAWSAKAQEAALMMSASARLSHTPDTSFSCHSAHGVEAAGSSNLYLGRSGPSAITGYMEDPGSGNTRVGHRNWILHPTTRQMGTGDIPSSGGWSSNSLWVFDNVFGTQPALRESEGFVAWPNRGYVPGDLVYSRWSFGLRGADFSGASVSVTVNGQAVAAPVVHRDSATNGAPFPILVWEPQGIDTNPSIDTTYQVTVAGARLDGALRNFTYNVTILGLSAGSISTADYDDFVNQAFLDFIGRKATTAERVHWTNRLATGTTRFTFVSELAASDAWTGSVVYKLYVDTLGRGPDAAGQAFWTGRLQAGDPVAHVAAAFYGSPEYVQRRGGTYTLWVRDLYSVLLERSPDNTGLGYWANQAGQVGTDSVALGFYQSDESRQARVTALYQQFLGRNPDRAGLLYWAEILRSGDDMQLAAFLASSDEYLAAAG